jgi:serine/threonine protein kinase
MRAGSMLAGRYRLVDLLSESRGAHFWRAWDTVLSRHVAVHLIADEDDRAEVLMDAARRSATLFDAHLLRVLDADHTGGICFVVNEWGEGDSLDRLLLDGPLAPRRAAWVVHEVGTMIATAHAKGIAHGRLVPENVLIDEAGSVKVIGFAVDAALNGMPVGRVPTDVVDLAAVLYAALTGKWPGVSRSAVPPAPQEHGRALRPRQVRAGVPRVLDGLCDEVLSPYPGAHDQGYDSAQAIVDALEAYVGDLTAVAAAEAARHRGNTSPRIPRIDAPLALAPETSPGAAAAAATTAVAATSTPDGTDTGGDPPAPADAPSDSPSDGPSDSPVDPPAAVPDSDGTVALPALAALAHDAEDDRAPESPDSPDEGSPWAPDDVHPEPAREQTQLGAPVFDDLTEGDWYSSRTEPVPPPPPFEETPERPLFAPDPPEGRAARVPRSDTGAGTGAGFWPWETDPPPPPPPADEEEVDDDGRVPGRNWLRIAALLALGLVILLVSVFAFNRGRNQGSGDDDGTSSPSPSASTSAPAEPLAISSATDFDPFGDPPEENPDQAPLAIDGKPDTAWTTSTYQQNFGPTGLKDGVGVLLDLGGAQDVRAVDVTLVGSPTSVQLLTATGAQAPTAVDGFDVAAEGDATKTRLTLTPDQPVRARWLVVWLTSLPDVGGFRGGVAEVVVRP